MTTTEPPDAPLVVAAFLARYFADQEAGTIRTGEEYEALFPGYGPVVAAELQRIQQGEQRVDEVEGERLAGYRILRELGRGGQGIVYLAEDERLARQVALKVLPGAFSATVARQRLLREAQAASRLDDPGICTVYDAGEQDGVAYIAMQFVDGESLHERIDRERAQHEAGDLRLVDALRIKELLGTFEAVLRSLHRAHEKGLVHRDIKPSNLMINSDGTPMILDFGLAAFDDHPDGSLTGEVALGTPAYMSPEQLTAREGRVDARSDVFSLAVTFYEALALQHPFEAPTRERLYQHILQDEAPLLQKCVPGLPRDLDVVLQCALDKDRTRRYASAQAFADDLRAVRLAEPISARKVSRAERLARWAQRNPLIAALSTLLLVAIVTFTASIVSKNRDLTWALQDAEAARSITIGSLDRERAARERSEALYLVGLASGQVEQDPELALLLAREGRRRLDHHLTRSMLRAALEQWRPRPRISGVVGAHWARLSPNGTRVAIDAGDEIVLFDSKSLERTAAIACADSRNAVLWWSDDGERLVVAERNEVLSFEGTQIVDGPRPVRLHRADGRLVAELSGHRGKLTSVDFEGRWLVTGDGAHDEGNGREGTVRVWSLVSGRKQLELPGCRHGVAAARFVGGERARSYPDIDVLSRDGVFRRVQGRTGKVLDERRLVPVDTTPRPALLLGYRANVYVDYGDRIEHFEGRATDEPRVRKVRPGRRAFLDRGILISRSGSQRLTLPFESRREQELPLPPREIVHVGSGSHRVFRGSFLVNTTTTIRSEAVQVLFADGSIRVWDINDLTFNDVPPIGGGAIGGHFSRDGKVAAVVDADGGVRVFEVFGGWALTSWGGAQIAPWEALHPDGKRVVTYAREGPNSDEAALVDLTDGSKVWGVEPHGTADHIRAAFSPDGELCALGAEDGELHIVRAEDGTLLLKDPPTGAEVRQLAFDPSGRYLAVLRGNAEIWDVESKRRLHVFADVPLVASLMFAHGGDRIVLAHTTSHQVRTVPDGKLVGAAADEPWALGVPSCAVGSHVLLTRLHDGYGSRVGGDGQNWLLDTRDGSRVQLPGGPYGRGGLSPDGRLVALPRPDGSIEIFDRDAERVVRTLRGHDRKVNRVLFSADGTILVSAWASNGFVGSLDERRVCVWSGSGELLQQIDFERAGVSWLQIAPDGEWIVVKTNDGVLCRYPVHPMKLVESLELREFTDAERERFELR